MRLCRTSGAAAVAAAALVGAVTGGPGARPAHADALPTHTNYMQIVAHQDDDILFMNPDMSREYDDPTMTVYLTAGELSPAEVATVQQTEHYADPCDYANSREAGARAAHAQMAGLPNSWDIRPATFNNHTVEVDTLLGTATTDQTRLVFLKLHQSGDSDNSAHNGLASLDDLYTKAGSLHNATLGSLSADGSSTNCDTADYPGQTYTHDDLVNTLAAVMQAFTPNVVLAQDPKVYSLGDSYHANTHEPGDNSDHRGASRFAGAATRAYGVPGGANRVLLRNYRDYNVRMRPANLGPGLTSAKNDVFAAYMPFDQEVSKQQPSPTFYGMFPSREYPRWSNGTNWAVLDDQGLVNAFAVVNGQAAVWHENTSGGTWSGATAIGGTGTQLAPYLTAVKDQAGLLHVFGIGLDSDQIVTLAQNTDGSWPTGWTALGNPNPSNPVLVGSPVVTANQNGLLTVFVSNYGGGISAVTQQADGSWPTSWADLRGTWVQDGLAAALAPDGRIDLFAPTVTGEGGVLHWRQSTPNGPFVQDTSFAAQDSAGPVSVGHNSDGRLEIFYSQASTGHTLTQYVQDDGTWTTSASDMSSPVSMEGSTVLTAADGRMTLATRNGGGGVSLTTQTAANRAFTTPWQDLRSVIIGAPSAVSDGSGRIVVLALGSDAQLHATRQSEAGTDSPYGAWQTVGS